LLQRADHAEARAETPPYDEIDSPCIAHTCLHQRNRLAFQSVLQAVANEPRNVLLDVYGFLPELP
jgi:hypothetical protein